MLTTTNLALKKPQTSDASTALRTSISDNADIIETLLGTRGVASIATSEQTSSTSPVTLTTVGPSVTLTIPANALVIVRAKCDVGNATAAAANVYLYEDSTNLGQILSAAVTGPQAQHTVPGSTAGTSSVQLAGALVLADRSAGSHTYSLRYAVASGGPGAFGNRKLWVYVRSF